MICWINFERRFLESCVIILLAFVLVVASPDSTGFAADESARNKERRIQLAFDIGPRSKSLGASFAFGVFKPFYLGLGGGVGWNEKDNTFDKNLLYVAHADVFARVAIFDYGQLEAGVTMMAFHPHDDDDRSGDFEGWFVGGLIGYRNLFFGPRFSFGTAEDYRGRESGEITSFLIRLVFQL